MNDNPDTETSETERETGNETSLAFALVERELLRLCPESDDPWELTVKLSGPRERDDHWWTVHGFRMFGSRTAGIQTQGWTLHDAVRRWERSRERHPAASEEDER